MKNFLAALLLIGLACYMIHLCSVDPIAPASGPTGAARAGQSTPPAEHKTVTADVRFNATTIGIKNLDESAWPALNVFINGDPPFAYRRVIGPLAPGEAVTVLLGEFAKDGTGERFDPYRFKLIKVCIGGNGFDYGGYDF
jgi:hypothetical protein